MGVTSNRSFPGGIISDAVLNNTSMAHSDVAEFFVEVFFFSHNHGSVENGEIFETQLLHSVKLTACP